MRSVLMIVTCFSFFAMATFAAEKPDCEEPFVFQEDFSAGAERWVPTDQSAWVMKEEAGKTYYSLIRKRSKYEPPVRSPYNRAILKEVVISDFVMDVTFRSTIPDYNHRDLCLFFGYQDESHFYYVHFGKKTDDHANQIFIVNEKPRTKISTKTTPGTDWDDEWHHARIERDVESGAINIYFDDMQKPIMTAIDKTFTWGQVGIGSFDDTGDFDVIKITGTEVEGQP